MSPLFQSDILDESQIWPVLNTLDRIYYPKFGCNLRNNIESLRLLVVMDKVQIEVYLAEVSLISLNDDEYIELHEKIQTLLAQNLEAAQEQWMEI
jgi:hypothetical protein